MPPASRIARLTSGTCPSPGGPLTATANPSLSQPPRDHRAKSSRTPRHQRDPPMRHSHTVMIPRRPGLAGPALNMPRQAHSSRRHRRPARRPSATPELALSHVQGRSHAVSKHRPAARYRAPIRRARWPVIPGGRCAYRSSCSALSRSRHGTLRYGLVIPYWPIEPQTANEQKHPRGASGE